MKIILQNNTETSILCQKLTCFSMVIVTIFWKKEGAKREKKSCLHFIRKGDIMNSAERSNMIMIWESSTSISSDKGIIRIQYFVLPPVPCGDQSVPCYGIGISDGLNTHTVKAFCPERKEAVRIAELLCRMQVTPTTFWEVIEDYLATR